MHGHSPGFALLRSVEVDSMGGFVDCGAGSDVKASPRYAAIEKAQAELRKEYDVREERKRELDFLEKGGNPLDFKFGCATSVAQQSTSFTDQQAEQYVISEAKGGFALAASPHGDSVGSSGRLGGSVGKESNIADNLLLFDGENSNPGREKNVKRTNKRGNVSLREQPSATDGCTGVKETEDSLIFHLGVKSQAYTRRNRSRSNRDSHINKSIRPSSLPDQRDVNRSMPDSRPDNHVVSSMSNSEPIVPNGNAISKMSASDNQLDSDLDGVQTHASVEMVKDEVREVEPDVNVSGIMQESGHSNHNISATGEQVANSCLSKPSLVSGKDEVTLDGPCSNSLEPAGANVCPGSAERVGCSSTDRIMTDVVDDDLTRKNSGVDSVVNVGNLNNLETNISHADNDDDNAGDANNDNRGMVMSPEGRSTVDPKESSICQSTLDDSAAREKNISVQSSATDDDQCQPAPPNSDTSTIRIKDEAEKCDAKYDVSNAVTPLDTGSLKTNNAIVPKTEKKIDNSFLDSSHSINKAGVITSSLVVPDSDPLTTALTKTGTTATPAVENCVGNHLKLAKKVQEDAILKEARIIEANLKRAGQLSVSCRPSDKRRKCHWDFVLEEMKWMANDFMQERLWKLSASALICHRIASIGRSKFEHNIICRKQRNIARTLAKAVIQFWHSIDAFQTTGSTCDGQKEECVSDVLKPCKVYGASAGKDQDSKYMEAENIGPRPTVQAYAVRFLKYDRSTSDQSVLPKAPRTPDRMNDTIMLEKSWEDEPSEEYLFYKIPPGAMQAYRDSVESQWVNYKKISNPMPREDYEGTPCDSLPDGSRENEYEEEQGETGSYYLTGTFEGAMSPKHHKKRKNFQHKSYTSRLYNVGNDYSYEPFSEGRSANQGLMITGKRPSSTLTTGSIPTKRVRTAARQRVVSPFSAISAGNIQLTNKADASSGDTNSFQDDQSSMHGGSQSWKNMEVESTADYETQFPFDGSDISTKSKKNKSKNLEHSSFPDSGVMASGKGSILEQRLQVDSLVQHEQRDQVKKRSESQHFESNGKIVGVYGQHAAKKPKLVKQLTEPPPEGDMLVTGSLPSPVTSQMSYMSNQNKLIKIITNRERGKKSKPLKISARQSGPGCSWSTFEEQALVVLVHDLGPNWELVSDAINSTLQFKCIFRKPAECKERHKILMDKSAGDGADSVEDSGSSQSYPSTLPGIPKGSAIQLFQRLQGPIEGDTLKAHFEKIILVGQQLSPCRTQKDTMLTPVHSSHDVALSQTYPNNLSGGVLSPLDLCNIISSNPDAPTLGYQGSHPSGAALPNHQGSLSPVPSNSSANSMLQGSSGVVLGNNSSSPLTSLNAPPARDVQRYCVPRASSLPVDEQQRMHYTQMLSSRNIQQASMTMPGAFSPMGVDRGAYALPNSNGIGMMGGRAMPMSRPGFHGVNSPGMPTVSTSMLSSGGIGMANSVNTHTASVSSPGNSMVRPRDALTVLRPGHNIEDHKQMMMQDIQPQVSQGNAQILPSFNTMSAPFSVGTGLPPVQTYPAPQHQPSHQKPRQPHLLGNPRQSHIQGNNNSSTQQQAYAIRLAKERQLQRLMPHSQQPYSAPNAMPMVQGNSHLQQQIQPSSCASMTPSQPQHNKQQMPHNPQSNTGVPNQIKQRQRQQAQQQQARHQQQPKPPMQQHTKAGKGLGRGTTTPMHQPLNIDSPHVSGTLPISRSQLSEKHMIQQGQGFFSGSPGLNSALLQSSNHHKLYSRPSPQSSKQMPPVPSHSDACSQSLMPVSTNQTMLSSQQPGLASSVALATQQQQQINQNVQRVMLQQNRQLNDGRPQSSSDQAQKAGQMIPNTSLSRCADSVTSPPFVSSAIQWKPEATYESATSAPTALFTGSLQENVVKGENMVKSENIVKSENMIKSENMVKSEPVIPSANDGLEQKQLSGSVSMDGHVVGGQWQQPQQPKSEPQSQEQQQQSPHPHQQAVQGSIYARPSNSGPG